MTNKYDVYDAEAELLDEAAQAAINERPFYRQNELNDLTDQVRLLDHITTEAQGIYNAVTNILSKHITRIPPTPEYSGTIRAESVRQIAPKKIQFADTENKFKPTKKYSAMEQRYSDTNDANFTKRFK